ncbi:MAG: hypothetical protein IRZ08_14185 [Frankia sp.]|nr:hypothetical protein [Frankia sp.]
MGASPRGGYRGDYSPPDGGGPYPGGGMYPPGGGYEPLGASYGGQHDGGYGPPTGGYPDVSGQHGPYPSGGGYQHDGHRGGGRFPADHIGPYPPDPNGGVGQGFDQYRTGGGQPHDRGDAEPGMTVREALVPPPGGRTGPKPTVRARPGSPADTGAMGVPPARGPRTPARGGGATGETGRARAGGPGTGERARVAGPGTGERPRAGGPGTGERGRGTGPERARTREGERFREGPRGDDRFADDEDYPRRARDRGTGPRRATGGGTGTGPRARAAARGDAGWDEDEDRPAKAAARGRDRDRPDAGQARPDGSGLFLRRLVIALVWLGFALGLGVGAGILWEKIRPSDGGAPAPTASAPPSTAPAAPTTAPAQPAVVQVPGDWTAYNDQAQQVTFSHPSQWKVRQNSTGTFFGEESATSPSGFGPRMIGVARVTGTDQAAAIQQVQSAEFGQLEGLTTQPMQAVADPNTGGQVQELNGSYTREGQPVVYQLRAISGNGVVYVLIARVPGGAEGELPNLMGALRTSLTPPA